MSSARLVLAGLATGAAGLALATPVHAAAVSPAGISLDRRGQSIRVDFAPAAAKTLRRLDGGRAVLLCQAERPAGGSLLGGTAATVKAPIRRFAFRMPRTREAVVLRQATGRLDACALSAIGRGRSRAVLDVTLPLTERGRVALSDIEQFGLLSAAALAIGTLSQRSPEGTYPTTEAIVAALTEDAEKVTVEALPDPDAGPAAPGVLGVWSNGLDRVVVATLTPEGRRIFLDATGGTLSSNVPQGFGF